MAYLGNTPTTQAFTPAVDYFSGNGSTTAFTLSRPVASVAQVQVTIDNVAQNPSTAFTVSSNTITFTSAPLSGTNNIYVYYTSPITQVIAPGQGTVTATSMASSTGTGAGVFQTSPTITTPTITTPTITGGANLNGSTSGTITLAAPAVAGTNTITAPALTGTMAILGTIASSSTTYQASQTSATTGTTTPNAYTDWSGGSITLPAGTYYISFYGVIEVQNVSGGSTPVQGIFSCLILTDSSNNYIYGTSGNYVNLNTTYNAESMGNAFIYTVSTTTSYKLRFGYGQNSGTPTTTSIYLRGNLGINNSPATLTAIKLY